MSVIKDAGTNHDENSITGDDRPLDRLLEPIPRVEELHQERAH
jgi:hypothetical protein